MSASPSVFEERNLEWGGRLERGQLLHFFPLHSRKSKCGQKRLPIRRRLAVRPIKFPRTVDQAKCCSLCLRSLRAAAEPLVNRLRVKTRSAA